MYPNPLGFRNQYQNGPYRYPTAQSGDNLNYCYNGYGYAYGASSYIPNSQYNYPSIAQYEQRNFYIPYQRNRYINSQYRPYSRQGIDYGRPGSSHYRQYYPAGAVSQNAQTNHIRTGGCNIFNRNVPVRQNNPIKTRSKPVVRTNSKYAKTPVNIIDKCPDTTVTTDDKDQSYGEDGISSLSHESADDTGRVCESNSNYRETLIVALRSNSYDCSICFSKICSQQPIWSCTTCFHIYHLKCIKQWISMLKSQQPSDNACWRCPSCQSEYNISTQLVYRCFCGRQKNPTYHPARNTIPHGCDQVCGKPKQSTIDLSNRTKCVHTCTELCHPGPCPACLIPIVAFCPCGKIQHSLNCGDPTPNPCNNVCNKKLNLTCAVGLHLCLKNCHFESCPPCEWIIQTACYCGQESIEVTCGSDKAKELKFSPEDLTILFNALTEYNINHQNESNLKCLSLTDNDADSTGQSQLKDEDDDDFDAFPSSTIEKPDLEDTESSTPAPVRIGASFSCNRKCGNALTCGKHFCSEPCHLGDCKPCPFDPAVCLTCPCGRVPLSKLVNSGDIYGDRKLCDDPIPTCPNVCARPNAICGHPCQSLCHTESCPMCKLSINLKCRCGRTTKELSCEQFAQLTEHSGVPEFLCGRVCKKTKECGRHKCQNKCCNDSVHLCFEICGHRLGCGKHYCEDTCHSGPCRSCWRGVIHTELSCRCGATVLEPLLPCGTNPPDCDQPCDREHDCDHPVNHTCHSQPTCPPCTHLVMKACPGGHGMQFNLPCFQAAPTCGRLCNKKLPWCSHFCKRACHGGSCVDESANNVKCNQSCDKARSGCGHPCGLKCHERSGLSCLQAAKNSKADFGLTLCKVLLDVICSCGKRQDKLPCNEIQTLYFLQLGQQSGMVSFRSVLNEHGVENPLKLLPCTEVCKDSSGEESATTAQCSGWKRGYNLMNDEEEDDDVEEGNKNDANNNKNVNVDCAFQSPDYPDSLKRFALNNFEFASSVETQLRNIVLELFRKHDPVTRPSTENTSQTSCYHFAPMNKRRRSFIIELAEFYGVQAFGFDPAPHRHVMIIAKFGCAKLPESITKILKREFAGQVKFPIDLPKPKPEHKTGRSNLPPSIVSNCSYAQILRDKSD